MKQYVVDAFTDKVFSGNPAAVMVLEDWFSDELMTKITVENNLSETAFVKPQGDHYMIRWFTPGGEIDLCGHATLASAFVVANYVEPGAEEICFDTVSSGPLKIRRTDDLYEMEFPAYSLKAVPVTDKMEEVLGVRPLEAYMGRDLLVVLPSEEDIRGLNPSDEQLLELDGLLVQATARAEHYDCMSRTFAPKLKVHEDPVCGSGHCHVVPYWMSKLDKEVLHCRQESPRGGDLTCRMEGDRVFLAGTAALYSIAEVFLPEA